MRFKTRIETNKLLFTLRTRGEAILIERKQHGYREQSGLRKWHACGKWQAIEGRVDLVEGLGC